jgi:hypothetical protein
MSSDKISEYEEKMKNCEVELKRHEIIINQFMPLHGRLIDSGTSLIKLFFVINAGAILALLTFVGNQHQPTLFHKLQCTFEWLLIGITTSIISGIAEFLRQDYALGEFSHKINLSNDPNTEPKKKSHTMLILARIFGLVSLIAFVIAIYKALYILANAN